ncbi:protein phosphatase Slingshot homolog 2b isoform X2 [Scleropages formosus]|uniref:protein-serine/threonine phosphatase n=1 Tax=Scleropages formosus TaxID=113540 RepID=A0A8C9R058_SCLFO|nr:protein phosphatase Slingshot homolog 2-like isoform X2 [Scleropages formosus]
MTPYFRKNAVLSQNRITQLISESFLTVKGAALFLPCGNGSSSSSTPRATPRRNKHAGDLQQHLQTMFTLLRPEDTIRLAVRLESANSRYTRYMVVVSTIGRQDTEESVVLGIDFKSDCSCSVGLVLPLWSDTLIHLDGDGGFSVSTVNRVHIFKPVSVQAMWSALQSLHKACEVARVQNYYPGSLFLTWVSYYQSRVSSDQVCINEWNAMQDVQSHRADSPVLFIDVPTERERTERLIKARLREIMMQKDLENVTSKEIRTELEMQMVCNLREFKEFIDKEMIVILGQMDSPTEIFEHVYLGSEWNASNLEELQNSGVRFILNVTREIDNFFPGLFEYHNIRVYDEEATDLLAYWNDTYKFISKAKKAGAKCLVHCKMGVSRSASTVIAYAMKEYGWDLDRAFDHVKERRAVAKPNPSFMRQLEEYQGILLASKQRHNKLWRSHSDSNLAERRESPCKTPHTLGRADPHNETCNGPPSLQSFLDTIDAMTTVGDMPPSNLPVSNGLADSSESLPPSPPPEGPSSPSLPRPRATVVVPDERVDCAALNVAETVPVKQPSPPPLLHALPTPSPPPETETGLEDLEVLPSSGDRLESSLPVHGSKPSSCPVQGGQFQGLEPKNTRNAEILQESPVDSVTSEPLSEESGNDSLNKPSGTVWCRVMAPTLKAPPSEAPVSPLGTDSIDFFSAREKFVDLSRGQRPRSFSEQASQQVSHPKYLAHELRPLHLEDPLASAVKSEDQSKVTVQQQHGDGGNMDDNITQSPPQEISPAVSYMGSELQSVVHDESLAAPSPLGLSEVEEEEVVALLPPSPPLSDSPSTPPCPPTGPAGSVWCMKRQLEQRLREEPDSLPSSAHASAPISCPSLDSVVVKARSLQEQNVEREEDSWRKVEVDGGLDNKHTAPISDSLLTLHQYDSHVDSCLGDCSTSDSTSNSTPDSAPCVVVLQLEGATEVECDVDDPMCSTAELEDTWETLRELRAFLCETAGEPPQNCDQAWRRGDEGAVADHGVPEMEDGAHQDNLMSPSLMKRSASLAKLGCLQFSSSDLTDEDNKPASPGQLKPHLLDSELDSSPDDISKKPCVLSQSSPCSSSSPSPRTIPDMCVTDTLRTAALSEPDECDLAEVPLSPSVSPPPTSSLCQHGMTEMPGITPYQLATTPPVSVATRQQYGKTHPLRKLRKNSEKKRTPNFLYNTM